MKTRLITLLLLLPLLAQATPSLNVTLKWNTVTTHDDNSPIPPTQTVSYNVYGAHAASGPWTLAGNVIGTQTVRSNVSVGVDCYRITAVANDVESLPTAAVCVTVSMPVSVTPASPQNLSAQQTP